MRKHPKSFIALTLALGAGLALVSPYIYGVSFLFLLAAGALWLLAWWTALRLLGQRPRGARAAKVLRTVTVAALALALCSFVAVEGLILSHAQGDESPDAEVLIVLGAGLRGETPSLSLQNRLDAALRYLDAHPGAVAVLTGGQGPLEDIAEAEAMRRYLTARGVSADRLLLEPAATNTIENIALSRAVLAEHGLADKPVAVVSNEYHLYRVARICVRQGLEVQTVPAVTPRVGLVRLTSYLREYASVMLLYAKELLGVEGA